MDYNKPKMQNLLKLLVSNFGEGAVVNRPELNEFLNKNTGPEIANGYAAILKNPLYKVGKAKFLITMSPNPEILRDNIISQKEQELPTETRKSAIKLAKELMKPQVTKQSRPKPQQTYYNESLVTMDDIEDAFGGNDIGDILRTL